MYETQVDKINQWLEIKPRQIKTGNEAHVFNSEGD